MTVGTHKWRLVFRSWVRIPAGSRIFPWIYFSLSQQKHHCMRTFTSPCRVSALWITQNQSTIPSFLLTFLPLFSRLQDRPILEGGKNIWWWLNLGVHVQPSMRLNPATYIIHVYVHKMIIATWASRVCIWIIPWVHFNVFTKVKGTLNCAKDTNSYTISTADQLCCITIFA